MFSKKQKQPVEKTSALRARKHMVRKIGAVVFCFLFIVVGAVSYQPKPAYALLGVGDVSITAGDIPATIFRVLDKIWSVTSANLTQLAQIGLMNAIDRYVQQFAYEAALQVATGSPGQDSLIFDKPLLEGLANVGDAAFGDYLDSLSQDLFGHSLCEPIAVGGPNFKLQLTFFLERANKPPEPKCSLSNIYNEGILGTAANLEELGQNLSSLKLEDVVAFSDYFTPRQNQIGTLMTTSREVRELKLRAKKEEEFQRLVGEGFKDVTSPIAGIIKTPASKVKSTLDAVEQTATQKSIPDKPTEGSVFLQILARGLTTFSRTFLGEWTKQLFEKGLTVPSQGPSDSLVVGGVSGVAQARKFFTELIKPDFSTDVSVDVTNDLANCPADVLAQRWNNCRIDNDFKTAIDQQLTLKEAIDQGLVIGAATFGYDRQARIEPNWDVGFGLASLKVLRSYRIVPESWVLAAEYIKNVQQEGTHDGRIRWGIEDVMNCYEDSDPALKGDSRYPAHCRIDPAASCTGFNDENCINPFYHLVNPDWVLKAPATKCFQEGPGPEIVFQETIEVPRQDLFSTSLRPEFEIEEQRIVSRDDNWCAERQSCIKEDDEGNCEFYGQCVRERPIWRFTASSCPAEFNTCQSLTLTQSSYSQYSEALGEEANVAYLTNTLVKCDQSDIGCGWYSTYRDPVADEWEGNTDISLEGNPDRVYLDANAAACSFDDIGCTALYKLSNVDTALVGTDDVQTVNNVIASVQASGPAVYTAYDDFADVDTVYLRKPPAYLGCDTITPHEDCDLYATMCTIDDVNCKFYEPLNGDPRIPGVITPGLLTGDECSAECVGFASLTYVPSWFEDAVDGVIDGLEGGPVLPQSFVAATGDICTQAGCERFTNLDEVAAGGEGIEQYTWIRQCVTPGAPNTKTYFTWEGSDTSGFQLKRWVLLEGSGGAPCTSVIPGQPTTCASGLSRACTPGDPLCLEFFDDSGNTYFADLNLIVYASDDCHPLRREVDGTVYFGISSLSQSCQPENVGCREYKGAGANNIQVLFVDTFETTLIGDDIDLTSGWENAVISNESLELNGHSISNTNSTKQLGTIIEENKYYTLSFVAKDNGGGNITPEFENVTTGAAVAFPTASLTAEWQFYQLGPVQVTHTVDETELLRLAGGGFVDNIVLRESTDNYIIHKDSWDVALAAQCLAENAYNCQAYIEEGGTDTLYLKSFTSLCEEDFVGCTAFVDTHNTVDSTADVVNPAVAVDFNLVNDDPLDPRTELDNVTVPADNVILLVDREEDRCSFAEQGCQLVGQPVFDRQAANTDISFSGIAGCPGGSNCGVPTVSDFGEVAIINNPDDYSLSLCQHSGLFCSEFTTADGSIERYVDPGSRTCEYRENVTTSGGLVTGWFKTGTTEELCDDTLDAFPPDPFIPFQPIPSSATTTIPAYDGWVGTCTDEHNTCSQLLDLDPLSDTYLSAYYIIHDELDDDIAECSEIGIVDREAGCRLFADMSEFGDPPALYSEFAYDPLLSPDGELPTSNPTDFAQNTTNIVVKVQPDRVCEQFLHCASSLVVAPDPSAGPALRDRPVCLGIGLCSEIDDSGTCTDSAAELLSLNKVPVEQYVVNDLPSDQSVEFIDTNHTRWAVGMSSWGMNWGGLGDVDGLYPYHLMSEIGSPLTIPNSDFEDPQNFNHRYSTWPDGGYSSPPALDPILQANVQIVTRSGGINPYEGERMLQMTMHDEPVQASFITTAALPASPDLEMAVAFYANFDALIQPAQFVCTEGHINTIGEACSVDADCEVGPGRCEDTGISAGYCVRPFGGVYPECFDSFECNGVNCVEWTCLFGDNIGGTCNPNNNEGPNGLNIACPDGSNLAKCSPGTTISGGSICIDGDINKIGQNCSDDVDCESTSGSCEPVGSILSVRILDATTLNEVERLDVTADPFAGGWQQITLPFTIPSGSSTEEFRVEIRAEDPGLTTTVRGSIQIDNVEIRSGLKISSTDVVAPSCRLYARAEALSCDDVDRSNVTGGVLQTHKGWRGYCVEPVPDQTDVCMNWWPVDVVQGDVNFFGVGEVVDLDIASDLYYCLHGVGDRGNPGVTTFGFCEGAVFDDCASYNGDAIACEAALECEYNTVTAQCDGGQVNLCNLEGSQSDCTALGCTWNTDPITEPTNPYLVKADTTAAGPGSVFGTTPDNERIMRGGKDGCSNWSGIGSGLHYTFGGCSKNCSDQANHECHKIIDLHDAVALGSVASETTLHKSQIQTIELIKTSTRGEYPGWVVLDRSLEVVKGEATRQLFNDILTEDETAWFVDCARSNPPQGDNGNICASSSDLLWVGIIFDANGFVSKYFWFMDDYSGKKSEAAAWRVEFLQRDICQTIARVNTSYQAHTPWLSRFENSHFDLLYQDIEEDANPYGSIAPPSNDFLPYFDDPDNPWLYTPMFAVTPDETLYCGDKVLPGVCARSGSHYSTQNDAGLARVCISGAREKLGVRCTNHDDCFDPDEPQSKGLCGGYEGNDTLIGGAPFAMDHGINRLKQLWARSYDLYGWDYVQEKYIKCDPSNPSAMPFTCTVPESIITPGDPGSEYVATHPVGSFVDGIGTTRTGTFTVLSDYDITGCGWDGSGSGYPTEFVFNDTFVCSGIVASEEGHAPEIPVVRVDDKTDGSVAAFSGQFISLSFYPNVDENRQPLKGMKIDWGDGTPFKPNQDLSNLAGQGLPIQNYIYVHQYICGPEAETDLPACSSGIRTNCWDSTDERCVFIPRIQLKDNWGWCSPDVQDGARLNEGIYQCDISEGWIEYTDTVRVSKGNFGGGDCSVTLGTSPIRAGNSTSVDISFGSTFVPVSLQTISGNATFNPDPPNLGNTNFTIDTTPYWEPRTDDVVLTIRDLLGQETSCSATLDIDPTLPTCSLGGTGSVVEGGVVTLDWTAEYAILGHMTNPLGFTSTTGFVPPTASGLMTDTPSQSTTYTWTVNNSIGETASCTHDVDVIPSAPTNLSASGNVDLTWTDTSSAEIAFEVQRSPTGVSGSWTTIAPSLPINTTTYTDPAPGGGTWWYQVRALGSGSNSAWSNAVSITTTNGTIFVSSAAHVGDFLGWSNTTPFNAFENGVPPCGPMIDSYPTSTQTVANCICTHLANRRPDILEAGEWKAWLSADTPGGVNSCAGLSTGPRFTANANMTGATNLGFTLPDGTYIADDVTELNATGPRVPINRNENNLLVGNATVWTNTESYSSSHPGQCHNATCLAGGCGDHSCDKWTLSSGGNAKYGSTARSNFGWTEESLFGGSCGAARRLYCLYYDNTIPSSYDLGLITP